MARCHRHRTKEGAAVNLPTTKPNDRDLAWYIKECEWMQTELGKLKTENEIMRNRLNSLVSNNNKQTDEYICVDREHGLWKRKEPKEPNVNADRLALALSLETIQELERENAGLREQVEHLIGMIEQLEGDLAHFATIEAFEGKKEAQP